MIDNQDHCQHPGCKNRAVAYFRWGHGKHQADNLCFEHGDGLFKKMSHVFGLHPPVFTRVAGGRFNIRYPHLDHINKQP